MIEGRWVWWRNGTTAAIGGLALWRWAHYDFVCDDAFIALRYARNLAEHGAPVYNLGERVEGYSSFSWVVLLAGLMRLGLEPLAALKTLSGVSAGLLIASSVLMWRTLWPVGALSEMDSSRRAMLSKDNWGEWGMLALLALSAPVGAWAFGGLETPLFAALCTAGVAWAARLAETRALRDAIGVGLIWAGAALTRPETPLLVLCCGLAMTASLVGPRRGGDERRAGLRLLLMAGALFIGLVGAHLLWRVSFYGALLPNTYYAKTSGDAGRLITRGLDYSYFTFSQLGVPLLGWVALLIPERLIARGVRQRQTHARSVTWWTARLWLPLQAAYVVRVGGDFLDLGRFFVPLVPLLCVALVSAWLTSASGTRLSGHWRWKAPVVVTVGLVVLTGHGVHQWVVSEQAVSGKDARKPKLGIESLKWTRTAAQRWAATGRWLREHADPSDLMAVGAAGAMPYYAELPNLDTFGLCDAQVAREGKIVGSRPGHQRFATAAYIKRRRPIYLFVGDAITTKRTELPKEHGYGHAYVWVRAVVERGRHGAPKTFYHRFLMRRKHAEELASRSPLLELK